MNNVGNSFKHYGFTYTREKKDPDSGEIELVEDPVQVGAIMIENSTGKILSFIGGRDHAQEATNHATQAFRQNGSSMKPLLVYAPAIEYGVIGAGSPVVDIKFDKREPNGKIWSPNNYTKSLEAGILPARDALSRSLNLATVRLYNDIIDRQPAEFLKKMDFSKLDATDYHNLSASFGGTKYGVSVEENTNAFGTFANGGQFIDAYIIDKIEDMDGNLIYQHKVEPVDVFSPATSYIVTDMLRDVLKSGGTGSQVSKYLNFSSDLAVKTGTTQNYADAWLIGYNPNVSMGVWLGYKDLKRSLYSGGKQSMHPTTRTSMLFAQLMNAANEVAPEVVGATSKFKQPEGVVTRSFCGISGLAPSAACSSAGLVKSDLFNAQAMLPVKPDDSITTSSYVSVKGTRYLALPSTPDEFITAGGTGVNQVFIERMLGSLKGDASKLFPSNSAFASRVISGAIFNADNVAPAPIVAALNGTTLTWSDSPSNDVIGYYIYENGTKIGTVRDGSANSYTIGAGSYSVQAVDITGKLSDMSNIVTIEATVPEEENPETLPPDNEDEQNNGTPPPTEDELDEIEDE